MILLDFDGVLFYTHDEAFYCAWAAANKLNASDIAKSSHVLEYERNLFEEYRYLIGDA